MSALAVNATAHQFVRPSGRVDNADMHKKRRDTPLARLMAAYDAGRGISDNALSRLTHLPQTTITRIANGTTKSPDRPTVRTLAEFFRVSEGVVLGIEERPARTGAPRLVSPQPEPLAAALSSAAVEVARAWMLLSARRQAEIRDAVFWGRFLEERIPKVAGRPTPDTYATFERNADVERVLRHSKAR